MKVTSKSWLDLKGNDPSILESKEFNLLDKKQQRLVKNRISADLSRR
jgi:hypothetical protein